MMGWTQMVLLFCLGLGTGVGGSWAWLKGAKSDPQEQLEGPWPLPPPLPQGFPPQASAIAAAADGIAAQPPALAAIDPPGTTSVLLNPVPTGGDSLTPLAVDPATLAALKTLNLEDSQLTALHALVMADYQGGFLARTSHELRSPLSSLMSLHQIILNDLCDDTAEERLCIQQAYGAAQRLLTMLETLTQLSKLTVGRTTPQIETVELLEVLQNLQLMTHLPAANRNVTLTLDLPDPDLRVRVDKGCLRQGLLCLLNRVMEGDTNHQAHLSHQVDRDRAQVVLRLEDDRAPADWQDPLNLDPSSPTLEDLLQQVRQGSSRSLPQLSPGMMFLLAQAFLESGGVQLTLVPRPRIPVDSAADSAVDSAVNAAVNSAVNSAVDSAVKTTGGDRYWLQCTLPLVTP